MARQVTDMKTDTLLEHAGTIAELGRECFDSGDFAVGIEAIVLAANIVRLARFLEGMNDANPPPETRA
jgi:hypothetical protein